MTKKPAHEIRLGLIKATIWEKTSSSGRNYSTKFCRLFKDGTKWRESSQYNRDDLLLIAKLADQAHSWIHQQQQRASSYESSYSA